MIWFIFVLAIPTLVEAWLDRKGETKDGKRKDAIWLLLAALLLVVIGDKILHVDPLKVLALLLGWRILLFDYLVTYLLIKNDVIVGHWFTYTGKTARWDKLISKVNPWVRLAVRVVLFGAALWWFLN